LRPLDRRPSYDFSKAREIIDGFDTWTPGDTLAPWDLRPHRDRAIQHFGRLWIEAVARGLVTKGIENGLREEALRIKTDIDAEGSSNDMLIEAQTVSETSSPVLWFLLRTAYFRREILRFLVSWLGKEEPEKGLRDLWVHQINI
jgi:hypothetical protein